MPLYLLDAVIVSGDFHSRIALNFTGNRSGDGDLLPAAITASILKGYKIPVGGQTRHQLRLKPGP